VSEELQKQVVELAWRHWTALGVAGVAPLPEHAIDLEALIAFMPFVAAADPRLARECVDWCVRIAPSFVSISRLRQIVRLMPSRGEDGLDLPKLLLEGPKDPSVRAKVSGKSRMPRLEHPALIQLRSRYIFGVGARADVISVLATRSRGAEAARISSLRSVGYTKPAVATVMGELAAAGVLEKLVTSPAISYKLIKGTSLRALLAPLPRQAPSWPERFVLIANVLETWRRFGLRASYPIELAKVLDKLRPLAATIEERPPIVGRPSVIVDQVTRWAAALLAPKGRAGLR